MKRRRINLTTRGKQTLIVVLTASGCMLGVLAAMLISLVCMGRENKSYVLACEKESVSNHDESETNTIIERCSIMVEPQWLFYQSRSHEEYKEEKAYMDQLVNRWTKGRLTDDELSEQLGDYLKKKNAAVTSVGVQSNLLCLFPSANELPDYTAMLENDEGLYDFIGIYTDGEKDEEGRLICYYWEAGVR